MTFGRNLRRSVPQLNTASLPDLIFTVLFFFMVVTHMRKTTVRVEYRVPQGTELTRLTKKTAVSYIYIGKAQHAAQYGGTAPAAAGEYSLQLNDRLATPTDVADYIAAERQRMQPDDRTRQTVSLKADRNAPMALVTEVKMSLRKANVRRINYSAEEKK